MAQKIGAFSDDDGYYVFQSDIITPDPLTNYLVPLDLEEYFPLSHDFYAWILYTRFKLKELARLRGVFGILTWKVVSSVVIGQYLIRSK